MEWDKDALEAVERAPFFVRGLIRKKVEEYVTASGDSRVTLAAVQSSRAKFFGGGPAAQPTAPPRGVSRPGKTRDEPFPIGEEELRAIERLTEQQAGVDTRFYAVRACGGAVGCPLTLADVGALTEEIARRIAASGVADYLQGVIRGPVLTHHKFRAAVAGCPNSCSEPQIKDFAVIAQARPGIGPAECIDCGRCVETCREDAVELTDGPVFDYAKCLSCGRCAAVCPTGAISVMQRGYAVLVGGKLGRHPQLAERLMEMVTEEEVLRALDACLELYKAEAQGPERLGNVLNRVGLHALRARLNGKRRHPSFGT